MRPFRLKQRWKSNCVVFLCFWPRGSTERRTEKTHKVEKTGLCTRASVSWPRCFNEHATREETSPPPFGLDIYTVNRGRLLILYTLSLAEYLRTFWNGFYCGDSSNYKKKQKVYLAPIPLSSLKCLRYPFFYIWGSKALKATINAPKSPDLSIFTPFFKSASISLLKFK